MAVDWSTMARVHARLRDDAAALLRALDARDVTEIPVRCRRFLATLEEQLQLDVGGGYRLLLRAQSGAIRHIAERLLLEHKQFARSAELFVLRWHDAGVPSLLSTAFRDDLEPIVSELMKQIKAEEHLAKMLSSVA